MQKTMTDSQVETYFTGYQISTVSTPEDLGILPTSQS